ncbi:MAG TPA: hypothetical protein PK297_09525 [Spirochaetota bacterium]|nr:hypothetical protein [Spirochaetota bacterium]
MLVVNDRLTVVVPGVRDHHTVAAVVVGSGRPTVAAVVADPASDRDGQPREEDDRPHHRVRPGWAWDFRPVPIDVSPIKVV